MIGVGTNSITSPSKTPSLAKGLAAMNAEAFRVGGMLYTRERIGATAFYLLFNRAVAGIFQQKKNKKLVLK
jgi:hypothetical protein